MNSRNPTPPADPIVDRLTQPENQPETEDVLELVGFVGPGRGGGFRIYPDRGLQRWIEVPEIVDSQRIDPDDELSQSVIWVDRQTMLAPIFRGESGQSDGRIDAVAETLAEAPFSTWNLIPETRLAAALLLGLIAYGVEEEPGGEET